MSETLQYRKNVTLEGECVIGGEVVEGYRMVIDSTNPNNTNFTSWPGNQAKYREYADVADIDRKKFREMGYAIQDETKAEVTGNNAE